MPIYSDTEGACDMRRSSGSGKPRSVGIDYPPIVEGYDGAEDELRRSLNGDGEEQQDEYEYVTIGEYLNPISEKVGYWASELSVFIVCIAIFALGSILVAIGDSFSTTVIVSAVILLSIIAAFTIYYAWNDRREKQALADKAEMIHDFVSEHMNSSKKDDE